VASITEDIKMQYKFGGITNKLIYWNIACFLISLPFFYQFGVQQFSFPTWIALNSDPRVFITRPWTLLSYAFFHDGFGHIFFNMTILNFSGNLFLTFFNQKQFIGLYILSSLFAGFIFAVTYYLMHINASIVGASGAIMAILIATTTYSPLMSVRLLLIGNVKLWHITAVVLLLDLMQIRSDNMGGHIAHLSGALFGFVFIKALQNGTDLSAIVSKVIDFLVNLWTKSPTTPFKKIHKNYGIPLEQSKSKITSKNKTQQQIDEILDKISRSGYDCLSKEEKEFLFKVGE
jgi:membrane associated rhomboid family serine protease